MEATMGLSPLQLPVATVQLPQLPDISVYDFHTDSSDTSPVKLRKNAQASSDSSTAHWKKKLLLEKEEKVNLPEPKLEFKRVSQLRGDGGKGRKRRASLSSITEDIEDGVKTRTRTTSQNTQEETSSPNKRTRKQKVRYSNKKD